MKKTILVPSFCFCLLVALITSPATVFCTTINYPDFSDTTGLTLTDRAAELTTGTDGILHLQDGRFQSGVARLTDPITLGNTFSTHFQFQIFNTVERFGPGSAADWLFFSIQTDTGIWDLSGNGIGVEFDLWNNGSRDNYNGNHIGVNVNYGFYSEVTQPISPDFNNEEIWNAWIDYDGSDLNVFASMSSTRPTTPDISYGVDIASILGTSEVYLAFHAASGQEGGDYNVLSWRFDTGPAAPVPEPATIFLISSGLIGLAAFRKKSKV